MTIKLTVINFCYSFLKMEGLTVKENMSKLVLHLLLTPLVSFKLLIVKGQYHENQRL